MGKLIEFAGNFSCYIEQKALRIEQTRAHFRFSKRRSSRCRCSPAEKKAVSRCRKCC
jgi:hypothetical protein